MLFPAVLFDSWTSSFGSLFLSLDLHMRFAIIYYCLTWRGEIWYESSFPFPYSLHKLLTSLCLSHFSLPTLRPNYLYLSFHSNYTDTAETTELKKNIHFKFLTYIFVWVADIFMNFLMLFTSQKSSAFIISPFGWVCDTASWMLSGVFLSDVF